MNGVCQSTDIRNDVSQFSKLEGCRVIEGFLQILLIDRANDTAYTNLTFPDLVEITGYFVLYRVYGLKSVGRLFPNLAVIRGHSLFINYALVAFEMMHLQEIGLHSLTSIQRGSVRFEKNPVLCYVDTVDWDIIAKAGKEGHVISGNRPRNGCPLCEKHCAAKPTKPDETLCWNQQHCQKMCDGKCESGACDAEGKCCHPSCLGGCTGPTDRNCTVCKDIKIDGEQCVNDCPNGTYAYLNRRCVSEEECRSIATPQSSFTSDKQISYKPFGGKCIEQCPAGYMDEIIDGKPSCKKCNGPCLKKCTATSVDSIASAQRLRGCTHIAGSLEIQIRGGKNIVKELEDNLQTIEEIDGYLKIVRSFPLISLNFLKKLRVIRGNTLDNNKYTLSVLDNQNLQELWDWDTHPEIKIYSKDGPPKVFFHFNPKLCLHKIEALRVKANLPEFTDLEVAPNSNGDKIACNVTELVVYVTKKTSEAALIEWEPFVHHDPRALLGYVVYFIEAPNKNITMYDGRDACGGDGWTVDDVASAENTQSPPNVTDGVPSNVTGTPPVEIFASHILTQLKPYTQYAFYVRTYTIATERIGAQSKVQYFTTLPDAPTPPRELSTWSNSSVELVMSWMPPVRANGNLTHYRIVGRWEPDDPKFIDQRNYCDEPLLLPQGKPIPLMPDEDKKGSQDGKVSTKVPETSTCNCPNREPDQSMREKDVSSSIAFEDALHNQVYIKRPSARIRRDLSDAISDVFVETRKRDVSDYQASEANPDKIENGSYVIFERSVPSTNLSYVMRNLRHFAAYTIEVQACRETIINDTAQSCSTKSMKTYRTLPLESADNIPPNTFKLVVSGENNSLSMVTLQWDEPPEPNGLVVTYQIEYKRIDIQNIKPTVVCITRRDFVSAGNSYVLRDLSAGSYSIKIRATSLAGNGAYTEVQYFDIPEYNPRGTLWIIIWSIFIIVLLVVVIAAFYICKRKLMRNVPNMRLIATVNPEYVSAVYVPDEWEVPRGKIDLLRELGNGSFGMVYEGLAKDIVKGKREVRCAVKTVNENATDRERLEFLNEASVMKAFNTHHVVKLLGVVSQGQPTLVVMELMENGDLKTYLRSHRPDVAQQDSSRQNASRQPPTLKRILRMAVEIADGMAYLAAKKFVHRDLAARNCMVAGDLTVKVGDFGMTRDVYETDYYRKGSKGLLPVRWMAPESLKDGVFTSYSDVWSYGVVLWEMVTFASQPYQGLSNDQVLQYVIDGGVMERPGECPDLLYELMSHTWNHKATGRPTFIDIITVLLQEIQLDAFERVSFYHSPEGNEARNQNISHLSQSDKILEMATLQESPDDEAEEEENSPLRQDFDDSASFESTSIKASLSPRYGVHSYGENSKITPNFHDTNSSKVHLKAGFDDFDGVSSKDTLNLPFMEDDLKSVRNSPFISKKSTSRGNVSQLSAGKSGSPSSLVKRTFMDSPNQLKPRGNPDYENRSPKILSNDENKETIPLHVDFPAMDTTDIEIDIKRKDTKSAEYVNKPESLNNGYIGGATT